MESPELQTDDFYALEQFSMYMVSGLYSEALEILGNFQEFQVYQTFFALTLNEMRILRTRHQFFRYIVNNR